MQTDVAPSNAQYFTQRNIVVSSSSWSELMLRNSSIWIVPLFSNIWKPLLSNVAWISFPWKLLPCFFFQSFNKVFTKDLLFPGFWKNFIYWLGLFCFRHLTSQRIVPETLLSFLSSVFVKLFKYLVVTKNTIFCFIDNISIKR